VRHWFRQRLGLTFSLALALILAGALAGIGGAVHSRLTDLDGALSGQSEQTVRGQAALLLARATQDEADHLNALFLKFESLAQSMAIQAGFLLDHAPEHLHGPETALRLRPQPGGWFADTDSPQAPAIFWGGPAPTPEVERSLRALGHMRPLLDGFLAGEPLCSGFWFVGAAGYARMTSRDPVVLPRTLEHDLRNKPYYRLAEPGQGLGRKARWTGVFAGEAGPSPWWPWWPRCTPGPTVFSGWPGWTCPWPPSRPTSSASPTRP
jgi:hypothetical protein